MELLRFELSGKQKGVLIGSNVGANDGHAGRFERWQDDDTGEEKKSRGVGPRGISTFLLTSDQFPLFGVMGTGPRAPVIMGEERGF